MQLLHGVEPQMRELPVLRTGGECGRRSALGQMAGAGNGCRMGQGVSGGVCFLTSMYNRRGSCIKTREIMAVVKSILNFNGRVGDFVVYELNGKLCMRHLPEKQVPQCEEVVEQQQRMKSAAILYRAMKGAGLLEGWKRAVRRKGWSAYNLFLQRNLPVLTGSGMVADFKNLAVTEGRVWCPEVGISDEGLGINDEGLMMNEEGVVEYVVGWEDAGEGVAHCRGDDRLGAVLMRGEAKWFEMKRLEVAGGLREEGRAVVRVPEEWRGWRYLYCFMVSMDGEFSPSVCIDLLGGGADEIIL